MTANAPAILVDGSSYLFRAYHALPPLNNSKGQPTGAIKGVINMVKRLVTDYPSSKIIVVFDAKGKTFRHDMYAEYKANRPPMPDDLRSQIQPIHDIIEALGLPLLVIPDVEADDVIGTLAKQATEQKLDVIVSTGDKDMAQLVNEHVTLMNTMTNTFMDEQGVVEKFGVRPDQIIDYLALVGDSVDNIPGVPKCGPKTAVKWLAEHDSFENVIANADNVGGKIGEHLRNALETLPLSYELATIKCDIDLAIGLADIKHSDENSERLRELYTEFEFKSLLNALDDKKDRDAQSSNADMGTGSEAETKSANQARENYETVLDKASFETWLDKLAKAPYFALDTETTSLDYMQARVVGVSFSCKPGEAAYVPFGHDYLGAPEQLDQDYVLNALKPLLEDPTVKKLGQNLKYDRNVLVNHDITLTGIAHDTMIESYVLNSTGSRHDMDTLADKYVGS